MTPLAAGTGPPGSNVRVLEVVSLSTFADPREVQDGPLTLRTGRDAGAVCIALEGEIDLSNVHLLEQALLEALVEGSGQVLVDMREVTFIDSTGIACLVRFLRSNAARLRFLRSEALGVSRVLRITGIEERLTPPRPRV